MLSHTKFQKFALPTQQNKPLTTD